MIKTIKTNVSLIVLLLLSVAALSGCSKDGGSAGMSATSEKKFSTRVDPNNPPPEAVAAMAKARGTTPAGNVPVGAPSPAPK